MAAACTVKSVCLFVDKKVILIISSIHTPFGSPKGFVA